MTEYFLLKPVNIISKYKVLPSGNKNIYIIYLVLWRWLCGVGTKGLLYSVALN